ncbi:myb-like protein X [Biomphalaria glabrata]|uniref:Myb-like protein X n=1 Tax=Biomphalaria glabrata TaxID=6526 RepID=A0A9W2ZBW0_BIOGL|nr:myb-like protein X [Biomphalaria glabrata]
MERDKEKERLAMVKDKEKERLDKEDKRERDKEKERLAMEKDKEKERLDKEDKRERDKEKERLAMEKDKEKERLDKEDKSEREKDKEIVAIEREKKNELVAIERERLAFEKETAEKKLKTDQGKENDKRKSDSTGNKLAKYKGLIFNEDKMDIYIFLKKFEIEMRELEYPEDKWTFLLSRSFTAEVEDHEYTGESRKCVMFNGGNSVQLPIAKVSIDTPYFKGTVEACVVEQGEIDLIIGNIHGVKICSVREIENWKKYYGIKSTRGRNGDCRCVDYGILAPMCIKCTIFERTFFLLPCL